MNSERLSGRQLSVATLVGGLSWAGAFAGHGDWRWLLAAAPPFLLAEVLLIRKCRNGLFHRNVGGVALLVLYSGWSAVLLAWVLERVVARLGITNGRPEDGVWILALLGLLLLRMAWGRSAPFFRAVEIFWLGVIVLLGALLLPSLARVEWSWIAEPPGDWERSVSCGVLTLSPLLFTLPYIYKVEGRPAVGWQAALSLAAAGLSAVTVGLLSPAVAGQLTGPLFLASGILGESVRGEGLISALWLLPDLTLAGILCRCWGGRFGPFCGAGLSVLLVLMGVPQFFSAEILALGTLILALLTLLIPVGKGRLVVPFW